MLFVKFPKNKTKQNKTHTKSAIKMKGNKPANQYYIPLWNVKNSENFMNNYPKSIHEWPSSCQQKNEFASCLHRKQNGLQKCIALIRWDLVATASFVLKMESILCSVFLHCPEEIQQSCHLSGIHLLWVTEMHTSETLLRTNRLHNVPCKQPQLHTPIW